MEKDALNRYFPTTADDAELTAAFVEMRVSCRALAEVVNKLLPESPSKGDIMGRLFRIEQDAELAIRMDGVNRTVSPIVSIKH